MLPYVYIYIYIHIHTSDLRFVTFFCASMILCHSEVAKKSVFCPSRPDPGRNAREQDGTRTGRDGPHLGTWMGPKHCKTEHMANLDGTTSDSGWDLDGPRIGVWMAPPRDSNRLLGLSEPCSWEGSLHAPYLYDTLSQKVRKVPLICITCLLVMNQGQGCVTFRQN